MFTDYRVFYTKTGRLKYISHLDEMCIRDSDDSEIGSEGATDTLESEETELLLLAKLTLG